mgnify:FL=1
MPEDIAKTKGNARQRHEASDAELEELREAALLLGRKLKDFGRARLGAAGADVQETSEELLREGRQVIRQLEHRVGTVEKRVETSIRDHPGGWLAGVLGVIGFGLVLGMILRRHE